MRLLYIETLELQEFNESDVPDYAILSHTWGKEEVSFEDMVKPTPDVRNKAGFHKIQDFASMAARHDFEYIWVDTGCIRKDSSSELSEAINSMYAWYRRARRCYVYLDDVDAYQFNDLRKCRWLSRGWTLQEFIAPADINFYSKDWSLLFTKENDIRELSTMTGISLEIMLTCDPSLASVAQRMSWAARRVTTRPEDMAYCLLGIFDVNMPMLYGEGRHKAFLRLQEEIMKKSDDQSLFAWRKQEESYSSYSGLLAPSPKEFVDSHDVAFVDESLEARPYVSTNKGISLRLDLIPYRADINERDVYLAFLDCRYPGPQGKHIGILLKRLDGSQFVRVDAHRIFNQPSRHEPPTTPHSSAGSPNEDERIVAEQASMLRQIIQIKQRIFDDALYERLQSRLDSSAVRAASMTDIPLTSQPHDIERGDCNQSARTRDSAVSFAPTDLYIRQSVRLPRRHRTPRAYGFVLVENIYESHVGLKILWPRELWRSRDKCIRFLPSEQSKLVVLCCSYYVSEKYDSTMCIVLLRWDKRSGHFSTCCFEDTEFYKDTESWRTSLYNRVEKKLDSVGSPYSEDIDSSQDPEFWRTSISNRVEKLSRLVGNESAESSFKSLERIFRVKVNLQLEMRGDEVVIKASVTVGGIS
ncbi:hypothetical protein PG989_009935 [Apiospora arundinis]